MKDIKKNCEKCGTALEYLTRCDYCGKVIPDDKVFHYSLIIKESDPESNASFTFNFCNYGHMTFWMNKRKVTRDSIMNKEFSGITPYNWQHESDRFKQPQTVANQPKNPWPEIAENLKPELDEAMKPSKLNKKNGDTHG